MFELLNTVGDARRGRLTTAHGVIETPFFMPIATKGAVKGLDNQAYEALQNQIILSNTYHLMLRPGEEVLNAIGGLHSLMQWNKPLLTDSGGFQVFSLAGMNQITDEGVTFNSHIDGAKTEITPERSMEVQHAIGSDIWMCFDYFPGFPTTSERISHSVELTTAWAERCKQRWQELIGAEAAAQDIPPSALFGIVQGSSDISKRIQSAQELQDIGFNGYAVGGLAVGEPPEVMYEVLEGTTPELPDNKPRYLMGVGQPEQILEAVKRGIDMFDCVLPTRNARHGQLYMHLPGKPLVEPDLSAINYERVNITAARFKTDMSSIDPESGLTYPGSNYSKAYIRHLFSVDEATAKRVATLHNLSFYMKLMREIRQILAE